MDEFIMMKVVDDKPTKIVYNGTLGAIASLSEGVMSFLMEKNKKYGDTALNPSNDFSNAEPVVKLLVRAEDKLSRIRTAVKQGIMRKNDYIDLIGYLYFIMIAKGWIRFNDQFAGDEDDK